MNTPTLYISMAKLQTKEFYKNVKTSIVILNGQGKWVYFFTKSRALSKFIRKLMGGFWFYAIKQLSNQ